MERGLEPEKTEGKADSKEERPSSKRGCIAVLWFGWISRVSPKAIVPGAELQPRLLGDCELVVHVAYACHLGCFILNLLLFGCVFHASAQCDSAAL